MSRKKNQEVKTEKPSAENKEDLKENIDLSPEEENTEGTDEAGGEAGAEKPEAEAVAGEAAEDSAPEEKKDPRDEKIEELNDKNLRLMAEFENFRKRSDKEKDQMFETGAKSVIEKVLPVIDNFERALDMAPDSGEGEENADPFMDGMKKVYKQLMDELDKIGVKPIEAVGQEFNPEFHNAVMQVDSEEYDSGIIAQELQKGYMYNDSVVRHSMVGVAK
ncbi:MAG: nucleotide exchange factor GrpE [Lachnospiraceae bacterium]|nr:nucleotide exchange factor GrpE [Lachnospiraceae bacterium]